MAYELPPLPYAYNALEPHIDEATMHYHHDNHHATYVKNLNAALESSSLAQLPVEEVLRRLAEAPEAQRTAVRNNGGGHANHSMFWKIMKPNGGGKPVGALASAIEKKFGSFDQFKSQFNDAGLKRFGSGWVWLVLNNKNLEIRSTANQDSPYMEGLYPVMGNDVWEHAYYIKYQFKRADYLNAWWNVVNWEEVNRRYEAGMK